MIDHTMLVSLLHHKANIENQQKQTIHGSLIFNANHDGLIWEECLQEQNGQMHN